MRSVFVLFATEKATHVDFLYFFLLLLNWSGIL